VYFVHQFQLFLSNVYLRKPTGTILHLSSAWFITKIAMQWFPSSVAIQPVLWMALQSEVLYCAFCTPCKCLHMYSLLRTCSCEPRITESTNGNLGLITHTAKDGVQFLYRMYGRFGGEGFCLASVWWFSYYLLTYLLHGAESFLRSWPVFTANQV
jgi:hypothetical protein